MINDIIVYVWLLGCAYMVGDIACKIAMCNSHYKWFRTLVVCLILSLFMWPLYVAVVMILRFYRKKA